MADYVAREWSGGDIVTAANLNNIEQGIVEASQGGGGTEPLIVNITETQDEGATVSVLGKTWREIDAAYPNVVFVQDDNGNLKKMTAYEVVVDSTSTLYRVAVGTYVNSFETADIDGYPQIVG